MLFNQITLLKDEHVSKKCEGRKIYYVFEALRSLYTVQRDICCNIQRCSSIFFINTLRKIKHMHDNSGVNNQSTSHAMRLCQRYTAIAPFLAALENLSQIIHLPPKVLN